MKIGIVYDVIYPYVVGGVQVRNWELAKRLSQRGHQVTLFGMKHWPGPDTIVKEGVTLHGVCPPRDLYTHGRRAMWPPVLFAARVLPALMSASFDVIDVANFPYFPCFSTKIASSVRRSPLVVTWIEVWGDYWLTYMGSAGRLARLIERWCAALGQRAAAISEMTKRDLRCLGFRGDISVLGCGVDVERIASVPPGDDQSDVLFAGRLIKEKNVELLVRSIGLLRADMPGIRCTIIGNGPEQEHITSLIDDLSLQRHVRLIPFLPQHTDLFSRMKSARVLVNPSSREGFGIVALEANACGLPVITIKHPRNAICDLISDGINGRICEPTPEDIASTIGTTLRDSPISQASCLEFAQRHDWNIIATSVERFYEQDVRAPYRVASSSP